MYYDDADYDRYDAAADAADDAWQEEVEPYLTALVDATTAEVWTLADEIHESGEDQPHPWTWVRYLVSILEDEQDGGEDALQEELEEHYREEAEEEARDNYDPGPCCNDFSCPCGNTNNFRGL